MDSLLHSLSNAINGKKKIGIYLVYNSAPFYSESLMFMIIAFDISFVLSILIRRGSCDLSSQETLTFYSADENLKKKHPNKKLFMLNWPERQRGRCQQCKQVIVSNDIMSQHRNTDDKGQDERAPLKSLNSCEFGWWFIFIDRRSAPNRYYNLFIFLGWSFSLFPPYKYLFLAFHFIRFGYKHRFRARHFNIQNNEETTWRHRLIRRFSGCAAFLSANLNRTTWLDRVYCHELFQIHHLNSTIL